MKGQSVVATTSSNNVMPAHYIGHTELVEVCQNALYLPLFTKPFSVIHC